MTGTIGLAHGVSHFLQLAIPPLFPLLYKDFNVSWTALGFMTTLFFIASSTSQFLTGFVVDRIGARPVLIVGLFLLAGGTLACAVAPNLAVLYVLALLMGVGNGTFHPCDFAVLNANIKEHHLGYAYAVHGAVGTVGFALAPVTSLALAVHFSWQFSLMVMGAIGLLVLALVISQQRLLNSESAHQVASDKNTAKPAASWWQVVTVMCFLFFVLQTFAGNGISFSTPSILNESFSLTLKLAAFAVTTYSSASVVGVLVGGVIATHTTHHTRVAASGLIAAALLSFSIFFITESSWLLLTCFALIGFSIGVIGPSRDMLVRSVAPRGAAGRVYGFVYSGMDIGAALAPLMFGKLLDHQAGQSAYMVIAFVLMITVLTVIRVRRPATL